MDIKMESTPITPVVRKFDIGRMPVCFKCGKQIHGIKCCGETVTLRKYVEEVRKEKFNAEEWHIEEHDITEVKDIDLNAEIKVAGE